MQNSVKKEAKLEKEVILKALLEASQTLLNKININITEILGLEVQLNKKISKGKGEKVRNFFPRQEQNSILNE